LCDSEDNINTKYKKNLLPSGSEHPGYIPVTILKGLKKIHMNMW